MQASRVPTSCPNTLYTPLAQTLQGAVQPAHGTLQAPLDQIPPCNRLDQPAAAIENAWVDHRVRPKRQQLSSTDSIETAPAEKPCSTLLRLPGQSR